MPNVIDDLTMNLLVSSIGNPIKLTAQVGAAYHSAPQKIGRAVG